MIAGRGQGVVARAALAAVFALAGLLAGCEQATFLGPEDPPPPTFGNHHEWPSWSSLGWIAYQDNGRSYVSEFEDDWDPPSLAVRAVNVVTGQDTLLIPLGLFPDWSPDGTELAVLLDGLVRFGPPDPAMLDWLPGSTYGHGCDWKPDGTRIAWDIHSGDQAGIWSCELDGGDLRKHLSWAFSPSWHPSEDRIVCEAWIEEEHGIVEIDPWIEGGDPRFLRYSDRDAMVFCADPEYSPNGEYIAFVEGTWPGPVGLWVMASDGSTAREIAAGGAAGPAWSPDGTKLVYCKEDRETNALDRGVLWVIDVITGEAEQLTHKSIAADTTRCPPN